MLDMLSAHWHQIMFIGFLIVWATRSREQISELQKDVCRLRQDLDKNISWTQSQQEVLVQLRAEQDVTNKQITSLWDLFNKLRERVH
jgi:predicted nuclease with TOPRIM domain